MTRFSQMKGLSRKKTLLVAVLWFVVSPSLAWSQIMTDEECGNPFENPVGPFDYNDPEDRTRWDRIPIVERHHFNHKVESLEQGMSSFNVMDDIDYTLRAVPNHHRALYSAGRQQIKIGIQNMSPRTADCFFRRAMQFRPEDANVRLLYGIFLYQSDEFVEAEGQYLKAIEIDASLAEAYYNLGLLHIKVGKPEKAVPMAVKAYELGHPLPGLRRKLVRLGVWEQ